MCGIAGWLGPAPHDATLPARLATALHHRGPDDHGVRAFNDATLIHTRLSIIDLAPTGAQPMANEDGLVWVVFNGEIYNHHDLRKLLLARGHRFRGRADTEVLPHLYEEHGSEFFGLLRGMFALAIFDVARRRLLLARDRFGIKPLFFAAKDDSVAFASEINALRRVPWVDTTPNRQAIHDFAALAYIPAPDTFFSGIRALQPGEVLDAHFDGTRVKTTVARFHRWTIAPDPGLTFTRAAARADDLLQTAVERQLESDVPLGTFLSGGIDSSLVTAVAQRKAPGGVRSFNVRFPDSAYDETWAALAVADYVGSSHETLDIARLSGTWDTVTGLLLHAGQPFADTSLFAVNSMSRLIRKRVTVALSGDGGDESFGGYDSYSRLAPILFWQRLPGFLQDAAKAAVRPFSNLGVLPQRLPQWLELFRGADDVHIIENLHRWIREPEHRRLSPDPSLLPVRRHFERTWDYFLPSSASRLERLSAHLTEAAIRLRLANDYLFKVDAASMHESLEVRVPLLDEDLVAFGMTLPHILRAHRGEGKRVLRSVASRYLPRAIARKRKQGFGIPMDIWVDAEFKQRLSEYLLAPSCPLSQYFDPTCYRPIIQAFSANQPATGISREGLYQRAVILLSVALALDPHMRASASIGSDR
jgi:asparagine synthase (glutamine-hydrolysing)